MSDEAAIQRTINTYSEGASRADWAQVLSTFLPDAVWEVPVQGVRVQGHPALQQAMSGFAVLMDYLVQVNSPAIITVDGDRATARSVIRENGKFKGRDEALEILGIYEDQLVRTANGWKFAHRLFNAAGLHTYPLSPQPAPAGAA